MKELQGQSRTRLTEETFEKRDGISGGIADMLCIPKKGDHVADLPSLLIASFAVSTSGPMAEIDEGHYGLETTFCQRPCWCGSTFDSA